MKNHMDKGFKEVIDFVEQRMNLPVLQTFKQIKRVEINESFRFRHSASNFHNTDFLICKYFYKPIHLSSPLTIPENDQ